MTVDPYAKGGPLEPPAGPRHLQMLRVQDGWLWRWSAHGQVWSPWLRASRGQVRRLRRRLRPKRVEMLER